MDFKNKTAIVTGGTRGIGKNISESLWELGCDTIITGTGDKEKVVRKKPRLHYLKLDFLDSKSIKDFIKSISKFRNIDILINNAGMNIIESIDRIEKDNWDKVLQVNLTGPAFLMKSVAKIMKKRNYGRILNISSIFGVVSKEKRNAYSASKTGLIGLTRAAALDLAKYNILVNALCPGFTMTDLSKSILSKSEISQISKEIPLQRFANVDEIAKVALFLCSGLNTYITGQAIIIDGGFAIK